MVSFVREQRLDAIVVEKTDRIYRNLKDRVTVDELDVALHLVKEGEVISKDSRSHAKFTHDIKLVVSKNYIDNLSEEIRKGMLEKARQGIWPSNAPLGYLNAEEGNRRVIVPDPERALLVAALFEEYALCRASLRELSQWAFMEGLRSKKGHPVGKSALARMLGNNAYCGLVTWLGETHVGQHPPLVSRTLYDRVQDLMQGRNHNNAGFGTLPFAYRGLFTCGCGLTAERKKGRYVYYHCTGNRGACPNPFVRGERLTEAFAGMLDRLAIPREVVKWVSGEFARERADEGTAKSDSETRLRREETRVAKRLETLYADKLAGDLSLMTYRSMNEKTEADLAQVRGHLATLRLAEGANRIDPDALLELAL